MCIRDSSLDRPHLDQAVCSIRVGGQQKQSRIPFPEALMFDLERLDSSGRIDLSIEQQGRTIANGNINIPNLIESSPEIEKEDTVPLNAIDRTLRGPVEAKFFTLYLNRSLYNQRQAGSKQSTQKSPTKTGIKPSETVRSSGGRAPAGLPETPKKKGLTDDDLGGYLNKVVDKYMQQAKLQVDNKEIEDSMHLNRFHQLVQSVPNVGELPVNLTGSQELDQQLRERLDTSPEGLRNKYEGSPERSPGRGSSPNKKGLNKSMDISGMALDAEVRRHTNEYKNQVEYLKLIVYAMDLKLADHEALKKENELLRLENEKGNESRKDLHREMIEKAEEWKREAANNAKLHANLINERNQLLQQNRDLGNKYEEINNRYERLESMKNKADMDVAEMNLKQKLLNDLKTQLDFTKVELVNSEKKRAEAQEQFGQRLRDLENLIEDARNQNAKLQGEKGRFQQEINDLRSKLDKEKQQNIEVVEDNNALRRKLQVADANKKMHEEVREQRDQLLRQLNDLKNQAQNYNNFIESAKAEVLSRGKEHEINERKYYDQTLVLQKKNQALDDKINQLQDQVNHLQKANAELKGNVASLEQLLSVREDLGKQLELANDQLFKALKDKDHLKHQLDLSAEYIVSQDEKNYELQKIIIYLKNLLAEKDDYIENLKKLILELKEKSNAYVPISSDPVDNKLADYVNNANDPNKLRVLFIREGEGVYQFGTKKVYVKIEQDKILIRVGGGYLTIDEFIETHLPLELEKFNRNDPIKVLTKNIAVNKTIAGRMVNSMEKPKTVPYQVKGFSPITRVGEGEKKQSYFYCIFVQYSLYLYRSLKSIQGTEIFPEVQCRCTRNYMRAFKATGKQSLLIHVPMLRVEIKISENNKQQIYTQNKELQYTFPERHGPSAHGKQIL
eukprot:TRINITY_DN3095_c0_g1_i9.p1 TRINITY_DN3095_c0_g1~~TRINITY_DN3095_c0_g1_i9.p1  ORF type:complete len:902 (-),score=331.71 TRINITY_DN3095_c0_g1_i9:417-3122(-)